MTVRRAMLEISSAEFNEWQAYYQLEPFGDLVADQRHGVAVATMVNMQRAGKTEACKPEDFITWHHDAGAVEEPTLLDDPAEQAALVKAAVFGIKS